LRDANMTHIRMMVASLIVMLSSAALAEQTRANLTLYKTASSAACSDDETVWVDPKTQTFYLKGHTHYAKTNPGGYSCRKQAVAAGYRAPKPR
jgi:hypothetical protein